MQGNTLYSWRDWASSVVVFEEEKKHLISCYTIGIPRTWEVAAFCEPYELSFNSHYHWISHFEGTDNWSTCHPYVVLVLLDKGDWLLCQTCQLMPISIVVWSDNMYKLYMCNFFIMTSKGVPYTITIILSTSVILWNLRNTAFLVTSKSIIFITSIVLCLSLNTLNGKKWNSVKCSGLWVCKHCFEIPKCHECRC